MTTLEAYCKTVGWQGGTMHQARQHFAMITLQQQDSICNYLMSKMSEISDIREVSYFTKKRLENIRLIDIAQQAGF